MVIVKKTYRQFSEKKLRDFATNFAENLALNGVAFPTPPVNKATILDAVTTYESKVNLARSLRSDYNKGQVIIERNNLVTYLDTQVGYVEQVATSTEQVESVGLEAAATSRAKADRPPAPEDPGAKESDEPQSVIIYCKAVKLPTGAGKVSYNVFGTNEDGSEQGQLYTSSTSSRKMLVSGLTTGQVYYFYIRAKSTAGFGPPSKPIRWVGR